MNHEAHEAHKAHDEELKSHAAAQALARDVVDAGFKVHKVLGPGLLESTCEHCVAHELKLRGLECQRQVALPNTYKGLHPEAGDRLDMVVDDAILSEIKSVEALTRLHGSQLLTYLKFSGYRIEPVRNFVCEALLTPRSADAEQNQQVSCVQSDVAHDPQGTA